jgi:hypothetical protein
MYVCLLSLPFSLLLFMFSYLLLCLFDLFFFSALLLCFKKAPSNPASKQQLPKFPPTTTTNTTSTTTTTNINTNINTTPMIIKPAFGIPLPKPNVPVQAAIDADRKQPAQRPKPREPGMCLFFYVCLFGYILFFYLFFFLLDCSSN